MIIIDVTNRQRVWGCLSATELNPMLGETRDAWLAPPTTTTKALREFAASGVRLVSELCVGRYGPVYQAELLEPGYRTSTCRPVAAKTLSPTASADTVGRSPFVN